MVFECMMLLSLIVIPDGPPEAVKIEAGSFNRCGPIALQVCARLVGSDIKAAELAGLLRCDDSDGCSLAGIESAARAIGLRAAAVKWHSDYPALTPPAVVRIFKPGHGSHFVAVAGTRGNRVLVIDVPLKPFWVTKADLRHTLQWDGYAVHIAKDATDMESVRGAVRGRWRLPLVVGGACLVLLGFSCLTLRTAGVRWRPARQFAPFHTAN